jgi:hypothetical protein
VGDAGLEKSRKSPEKTRIGSVSGAQSGAVGADWGTLAAGDRDKIVEGFTELPLGMRQTLVEAAWRSLSDGAKGQILGLTGGSPK